VHLGDRAIPVVRPAAGGARARRDGGRARSSDLPGARQRARGRHGDPDGPRRPRSAPAFSGRAVGGAARRPASARLPAPTADGSARGHDQQPPRRQARERARALGIPGSARLRKRSTVDSAPGAPRHVGGRARDHRRLRTVRHRPGARQTRRWQQPRQHVARRAPRPDRVGPRRRARARGRRRFRPRPRTPLGRGWHVARHRESVGNRTRLARRSRRAVDRVGRRRQVTLSPWRATVRAPG
jgi:hypothetical protein